MSKKSRRVAKARRALLTLSLVLVMMVVAVGGTIAWLTDETETIVNTFTTTTIDVSIEETGAEGDDNSKTQSFQIIPGKDIDKDPKVSANATEGVAYYVFVTVNEENWDSALTYTIDSYWTKLEDGVYYKAMPAGETIDDKALIAGNKVYVSEDLTKEQMAEFEGTPTLTFQAYAIQQEGFADAAAAWDELSTPASTDDNTQGE